MSDGTVKVTAEAHVHITQLLATLQGPLNDALSQITSHGTALSDPNIWAGPAATNFASAVWPTAQSQLNQASAALASLQQQVAGIVNNITQAGAGSLPLSSLPLSSLPLGSLPVSGL